MTASESVVAVFKTHTDAETAVKKLNIAGFDVSHLSIIGKGYHTDEHVVGFYNQGDRIRFWGARGAFWGGLWGLFFGGVFITLPLTGPIIVLGYLATTLIAAIEGAVLVGGVSAIASALYGLGIPKDSVLAYETALKADAFLVLAHDRSSRVALARKVLQEAGATQVESHPAPVPS
jgi:hypothetical protein